MQLNFKLLVLAAAIFISNIQAEFTAFQAISSEFKVASQNINKQYNRSKQKYNETKKWVIENKGKIILSGYLVMAVVIYVLNKKLNSERMDFKEQLDLSKSDADQAWHVTENKKEECKKLQVLNQTLKDKIDAIDDGMSIFRNRASRFEAVNQLLENQLTNSEKQYSELRGKYEFSKESLKNAQDLIKELAAKLNSAQIKIN